MDKNLFNDKETSVASAAAPPPDKIHKDHNDKNAAAASFPSTLKAPFHPTSKKKNDDDDMDEEDEEEEEEEDSQQAPPPPPPSSLSFPSTVKSILGMEASERFAYYGFRAILVLYLNFSLHYSEEDAVAIYAYICAAAYFTPVVGAIVSDLAWGKFPTIVLFGSVYTFGLLLLTCGAATLKEQLAWKKTLSFVGLALVCLGTGGIKPCVSAFGADQLMATAAAAAKAKKPGNGHAKETAATTIHNGNDDDNNDNDNDDDDAHQSAMLRSYFAFFYASINAGAVLSFIVVPLVRAWGGFGPAFGLPTIFMMFAMGLFLFHSSRYHKVTTGGGGGSSVATTLKLVGLACVRLVQKEVYSWLPPACRRRRKRQKRGRRWRRDHEEEEDDDDDDPLARVRFSPSLSRSPRPSRQAATPRPSPLPPKSSRGTTTAPSPLVPLSTPPPLGNRGMGTCMDDSLLGMAPPSRRFRAVAKTSGTNTYGAMEQDQDEEEEEEDFSNHGIATRGRGGGRLLWPKSGATPRQAVPHNNDNNNNKTTTTTTTMNQMELPTAVGASPRAIFPNGFSAHAIGRGGVFTKDSKAVRQVLTLSSSSSLHSNSKAFVSRDDEEEEEEEGHRRDGPATKRFHHKKSHKKKNRKQQQRYTEEELEQASKVASVLPILGMLPMFWLLYDQQGSVWTLQATRMNRHGLQPEQLGVVNPIVTILLLPLFDKVVYPALVPEAAQGPFSFHLQRMSWGMMFAALAFVASALVDQAIVRGEMAAAAAADVGGDGEDNAAVHHDHQVSVFYQLPQILLMSVGEILVSVTGLEFAYAASPPSTKAVVMSLFLLTTTVGDLAQGLLYSSVFRHLSRSTTMYTCAVLMMLNRMAFGAVAAWWQGPPDEGGEGEAAEAAAAEAEAEEEEEGRRNHGGGGDGPEVPPLGSGGSGSGGEAAPATLIMTKKKKKNLVVGTHNRTDHQPLLRQNLGNGGGGGGGV